MRVVPLVVAILLFGALPGLAQSSDAQIGDFEGKSIREIVYDPAQQPLTAEDLAALQRLRAGTPYSSKDVGETIDRMFATGAYADIQVDVEQQPGGLQPARPLCFVDLHRLWDPLESTCRHASLSIL